MCLVCVYNFIFFCWLWLVKLLFHIGLERLGKQYLVLPVDISTWTTSPFQWRIFGIHRFLSSVLSCLWRNVPCCVYRWAVKGYVYNQKYKRTIFKDFFQLFDFLSISSPYFQNVHCFVFVFSHMKTMTMLMARKNIFSQILVESRYQNLLLLFCDMLS